MLAVAVLAPLVVLEPPAGVEHLVAVGAGELALLVYVQDVALQAAAGHVALLAVRAGKF